MPPPDVTAQIDANMDAIARISDVLSHRDLDAELRDQLLMAKSRLVVANRSLSGLSARCPLCATSDFRRVCANCGNHRSAS